MYALHSQSQAKFGCSVLEHPLTTLYVFFLFESSAVLRYATDELQNFWMSAEQRRLKQPEMQRICTWKNALFVPLVW